MKFNVIFVFLSFFRCITLKEAVFGNSLQTVAANDRTEFNICIYQELRAQVEHLRPIRTFILTYS